ncbi:hypothetical protein JNUCC0626_18320 [Lentzea sp. JNUCC 0626]|uniref:hypothetical protein n=1 Tax=Lentzea sp. JNUCC 0626 TaxID=3367513 RepID=UPI00374A142B
MANRNKAKGDRWENALLEYLREVFGRAAIRPRQEGHIDVGDLHISPFVIQAKDEAKHTFSSYVDDAEKQAAAAGEPYGVAAVKRRQLGVTRGYIVGSVGTFRLVVARLRRAEELLLRANPDLFDQHISETKKESENR